MRSAPCASAALPLDRFEQPGRNGFFSNMRIFSGLVAVVMLAAGCRSAEAPPTGHPTAESSTSLVGTSWVAEDIDGRGVLGGVQSTLTFADGQRIAGRAACNQYFGSAELGEGTLRLKPAGATRMACPPEVMEQETRFLETLGTVTRFRFDGGKLLLLDESGRARMRLAPLPPG